MKYLLLIYTDENAGADSSQEERDAVMAEYMAISDTPGIVGGAQLQPVATATTVRVDNGSTLVTDGPFVETKEYLIGFWVVEAPDLDVALRLAAEGSMACNRKVEVRPFLEP